QLDKPISAACARSCAKGGSPLVILTADGNIYWPISGGVPAKGQNEKLMPFAGEKVTVSGKVFQRAGSKAIVIEKIYRVAASNPAPPSKYQRPPPSLPHTRSSIPLPSSRPPSFFGLPSFFPPRFSSTFSRNWATAARPARNWAQNLGCTRAPSATSS